MTRYVDLDGAVAIMTGGGSGIGRAAALSFSRRGARVVVSDVRADRAEAVAHEIKATGGTAAAVACDVSEIVDVERSGVSTNIAEQITYFGEATKPRSPDYTVVEAEVVGELVADAVDEGRFLVLTAPELHEELVERADDIEAYLAKLTNSP